MASPQIQLCPDDRLQVALAAMQRDDEEGLGELSRLIAVYPLDPRLFFLKGSLLAGTQRYEEGRSEMRRAVEIAPDYALARFQLGFLEFTSGLPVEATQTWAPLLHLEEHSSFRLLALGLNHFARDEFTEAERFIHMGMAGNTEHPLINGDMQLLLDEMHAKAAEVEHAPVDGVPQTSAAHQLLQQFELKDDSAGTRH